LSSKQERQTIKIASINRIAPVKEKIEMISQNPENEILKIDVFLHER